MPKSGLSVFLLNSRKAAYMRREGAPVPTGMTASSNESGVGATVTMSFLDFDTALLFARRFDESLADPPLGQVLS